MQPKVCPTCKTYLSCDAKEWYCTECDYIEVFKFQPNWSLDDD